MCVCMYKRTYVCMYISKHACMYVCMRAIRRCHRHDALLRPPTALTCIFRYCSFLSHGLVSVISPSRFTQWGASKGDLHPIHPRPVVSLHEHKFDIGVREYGTHTHWRSGGMSSPLPPTPWMRHGVRRYTFYHPSEWGGWTSTISCFSPIRSALAKP